MGHVLLLALAGHGWPLPLPMATASHAWQAIARNFVSLVQNGMIDLSPDGTSQNSNGQNHTMTDSYNGHCQPWPCPDIHDIMFTWRAYLRRPWLVMARPWLPLQVKASYGKPWQAMANHGKPWSSHGRHGSEATRAN